MRKLLLSVGLGLAAAAGYLGFRAWQAYAPSSAVATHMSLPATELADLEGRRHRFADWHGKLLLVNFWATWCGPCLKEIPGLVEIQAQYGRRGLQILGPAVDDPDAVRGMLKTLGINYPVLTADPEVMLKLMDTLGNGPGGLPFSVLADGEGRVITQQLGEFSPAELRTLVEAHLPP